MTKKLQCFRERAPVTLNNFHHSEALKKKKDRGTSFVVKLVPGILQQLVSFENLGPSSAHHSYDNWFSCFIILVGQEVFTASLCPRRPYTWIHFSDKHP